MPKNFQQIALSVFALTLLTGCEAPTDLYIYRDGGTVGRADSDYFDCELSAARVVPTDTRVATTPTYTSPVQTSCYNTGYSVQCSTTGGQVYGGQAYTYDANSDLRTSYLARCLASKGYRAVELPVCDTSKIPQSVLQKLSGKQRPPKAEACYVPITENAGNILYASEYGG